jgi:hypothetical protein
MGRGRIALLPAILFFALAIPARAQDDEEAPVGPGRWIQVEGHAGMLRIDSEGWEPIYGGRVALHLPSGIGLGASAGFATRSVEFGGDTEDADVLIATGELLYLLRSVTRANLYGTIGAGMARFDATPAQVAAGGDDATEVVIPVGFGILWYNHPGGNWLAVRTEVRDNIVFLRGDPDLGTDNSIANDWELSVGLALLFGPQ